MAGVAAGPLFPVGVLQMFHAALEEFGALF